MTFEQFFSIAFGRSVNPFAYQRALAEQAWPDALIAPTGLGKTAAVVLGWAWRHTDAEYPPPRRLVYCLPMRTLVDQTAENVRQWLRRLSEADARWKSRLPDPETGVHVLMGGIDEPRWFESPEHPAILIGTQDMLLSRALMRGYAMSRFRWPVDFALLHNDTQWVFDEVQLMGAGLATSTQLEGFRRTLRTAKTSRSLWVSATLHPDWLSTVDFQQKPTVRRVPEDFLEDAQSPHVRKLIDAPKMIRKASVAPASAKKDDLDSYAEALAETTLSLHQENRVTLVVVNTVARAQAVHQAFQKREVPPARLALIHSRFRPGDRKVQMDKLPVPGETKDLIVVATQAIEAGVDLSAAVLVTELAPASSLVQRFGRVNRYGELNDSGGGTIRWIDLIGGDLDDSLAPPYGLDDLKVGSERAASLSDARPSNLRPPEPGDCVSRGAIRSKDILDLYDTDPDLTGFDVDVAPYIRDAEDTDIRVFWRNFDSSVGPEDQPEPTQDELCAVPLGQARDWFKKKNDAGQRVYRINPQALVNKKGRVPAWIELREKPWPGLVLLVHASSGGYASDTGFEPTVKAAVEPVETEAEWLERAVEESNDADSESEQAKFVGLTDHLGHVASEAGHIADILGVGEDWKATLVQAACWHDLGKAHAAFQARMVASDPEVEPRPEGLLAKAPKYDRKQGRPYFRHELASALAFLARADWAREADLVAYLIAAHHGKVRLNLRPLPAESPPSEQPTEGVLRFARGVWEGDVVPRVDLGGGETWTGGPLTLSVMELGEHPETGASWTERTRHLLSQYGPFRLAWLEALVRIADWRASAKEQGVGYGD